MDKIFRLIQQSLFIRLLAIFVASIMLFFFLMSAGLGYLYREEVADFEGYDYFKHHVNFALDDLGYPPDIERARRLTTKLPIAIIIRDSNGTELINSDQIDPANVKFRETIDDEMTSVLHDRRRGLQIKRNGYEYTLFGQESFADQHDRIIGTMTTVAVLFVLLLNYLLVRHLLRPISMLKEGAERITDGEIDYRVPHVHRDELGDLTCSINHMADTLKGMIDRKQHLLLAISHELRTPITRARLQLEMMPDDAARESLLEEINELDSMVSELLEAERLNSEHAGLDRQWISFNAQAQQWLHDYWRDETRLSLRAIDPRVEKTEIFVDPQRMKIVLRNLINNALKYGDGQPVDIGLQKDTEDILLVVRDQGQGIPAEHIPHLTEPFYRSDAARQRQTGGYGLGLYLCRLIVEAHGGVLEISSQVGVGTEVTVRLPLEYARDG